MIKSNWHKWFAWYPVVFDGHVVWLETIERRIFKERPALECPDMDRTYADYRIIKKAG